MKICANTSYKIRMAIVFACILLAVISKCALHADMLTLHPPEIDSLETTIDMLRDSLRYEELYHEEEHKLDRENFTYMFGIMSLIMGDK